MEGINRVWDGPSTPIKRFNQDQSMVQIGWWYEPEAIFVPITQEQPKITGSSSPVYCEVE